MNVDDSTEYCKNCGVPLQGEYCAQCGQRNIDFRKDWRGLTGEFFSSMFNLDGRVPRGIFELLFRPGYNAELFLKGKRASQIPPLRLYLFSTLVYFIWFTAGEGTSIIEGIENEIGPETIESEFSQTIAQKFENPDTIIAEFNTWLPRVFLLSVPVLALVTRFLFRKREFVLLEHLIVAMHLLTFVMLWTLLSSAVGWGASCVSQAASGYIVAAMNSWILIYPIFGLRRTFGLNWTKSIATTLVLVPLFLALFGIGIIAVVVLAVWIS